MSAFILHRDPSPQKILLLLLAAFALIWAVCCTGCEGQMIDNIKPDFVFHHPPQDSIIIPPPPPQDTTPVCINPMQITDPAFVTGYLEITDDLFTDITLHIGPYTYEIPQDETDQIDTKLDSLFKLWHPEYKYQGAESEDDYRLMSIAVKGTNDVSIFNNHTYVTYNGLRHWFGWISQGFVFVGSVSAQQYEERAIEYPSERYFFFQGTDWDSLTYGKIDSILLGFCKEGRDWADFRWGIHSPAMVQAFKDAGWNKVLSAWDDHPMPRFALPYGTIDMRGVCISAEALHAYLDKGYQVITDD